MMIMYPNEVSKFEFSASGEPLNLTSAAPAAGAPTQSAAEPATPGPALDQPALPPGFPINLRRN
jgi:hypothetical protein